jgi:hypothetical protein
VMYLAIYVALLIMYVSVVFYMARKAHITLPEPLAPVLAPALGPQRQTQQASA